MTKFIVRRLMWMLLVLFVVSAVTFLLMHAVPGGPFDAAGERALPEDIVENIEARYGLNDPLWFQYTSYIGGIVVPRLTYGEWQYKLTLDPEDAGVDFEVDEAGDPIPLSWPRRIITRYQDGSVLDNHLVNIDMPGFLRRGVPANLRDRPTLGGETLDTVETGDTLTVINVNSRGDFFRVRLDDGTEGWLMASRVDLNPTNYESETEVESQTVGAPATLRWMNFGPSYASRSQSVNDLYKNQLIVSAQLGLAATIISMAIGLPLGVIAALNRNTTWDYVSMGVAILGVSVPVIVLGPILRYVAVQVPWLPVSGWGTWQQMVLPSFALGFAQSALLARLTRASLLQVLNEDYIRTARAKGLAERIVVIVHALKNALIPVVTVLGPLMAALVTGSFVTESIFAIPGIGRYFITSVTNRDYPVIMGTILMYAFFLVLANMLVDVIYALLDPRIRYD